MTQQFEIPFGGRFIGPRHPVVVIAEVGINHEGDANTCARMIEAAAKAGADAVKLQTIDADENYVQGTESHRIFLESALSREDTYRMFELGRNLDVEVFTTCGDFATLDWGDRLNPSAHKISSGLFTNLPFIRRAAETGRTLLMSTGAAAADEIAESVAPVRDVGVAGIGLFQCTSLYPTPMESVNLANIPWLAKQFDLPTGFSDHTVGWEAAMLSVGAGACMIEKHFTLDHQRNGYDHHLSLEPQDFATLVRKVRVAETMLGAAGKKLGEDEGAKALELHRILVARKRIVTGEIFSRENLGLKRPLPGKLGLAPRDYERVLGQRASRDLEFDDPVTDEAVEGFN